MSAFFAKLWAAALPVLKNPGTWATLAVLLGALFGVPHLVPAPTVSLPASVQVKPMALVPIPVSHTGSALDLDHNSPDGQLFGPMPDGSYLGQFPTPQTVHLYAHTARAGKMAHAHMVVQVGDAPNPPGPIPPNPPTPSDPFTQGLQAAYASESDPQKAAHVQYLAAVFKGEAASVPTDAGLKTLADLFAQLHAVVEKPGLGLPSGAMPTVRAYLGQDMNAAIGTTANAPLDATLRQKVAAEFSKIAQALSEVH